MTEKNLTDYNLIQATLGNLRTTNWRYIGRMGLVAGIAIVYSVLVGMFEAFSARGVIHEVLSLGQLLLVGFTAAASLFVVRKVIGLVTWLTILIYGAVVGLLASVPAIVLIGLIEQLGANDLRRTFASISRDSVPLLTFEQENLLTGILLLIGVLVITGLVSAATGLIPTRLRRAVFAGLIATLTIGVMSELVVVQILQRSMNSETIRQFFVRNTMLPTTGLGIFVVVFLLALLWVYRSESVRAYYATMTRPQKRVVRGGGFTVLGFVLLILPWVLGSALSETMDQIGLYVLMGLGLNIAVGLAGLLDLGYVTNFAVGAYTMSILTSTGALGVGQTSGVEFFNFWLALPICIIAAMITGFIFAVPVLRMRGDYLAIATLGFGEIIRLLALSDWLRPLIGGAQGVLFVPKPEIFGLVLNDPQQIYYVLLAACLLAIFVSTRLNNSRTGRQWMAIREDEDVASAMGISTARAKLLAFTLSAATGGLAGGIFAAKLGTVFPTSFGLLVSINVLSLIIVGGMGSIPGIVVGAAVLIGLPELLREFNEFRLLLYGALLVAMMLSRPEGLWPSAVHRREMQTDDEDKRKREEDAESPVLVSGD